MATGTTTTAADIFKALSKDIGIVVGLLVLVSLLDEGSEFQSVCIVDLRKIIGQREAAVWRTDRESVCIDKHATPPIIGVADRYERVSAGKIDTRTVVTHRRIGLSFEADSISRAQP